MAARGGARPGSGRPKGRNSASKHITLTLEEWAYLQREDASPSMMIKRLIQQEKDYEASRPRLESGSTCKHCGRIN